jgi:hypothetical protein
MLVLLIFVMHLRLLFFIFMHVHLASHLGMLDEPHDKDVVGGSIPKMEGPSSACVEWRRSQDGAS